MSTILPSDMDKIAAHNKNSALVECNARIRQAMVAGKYDCYCEDVRGNKEYYAQKKFNVTSCWLKLSIVWDNERDPFGETLTTTHKQKALYVNWDPNYRPSWRDMLSPLVYQRNEQISLKVIFCFCLKNILLTSVQVG